MSTICSIHYMGHSAWLIETPNRLLLFDYGDVPRRRTGGLADGRLLFSELPDLPLYVFSSHGHIDHYSESLHLQTCQRPKSIFIMGLDAPPSAARMASLPACTRAAWPRCSLSVDDMAVTCSGSTDCGVSFLVDSPEGVFYHGGDLAVWDSDAFFFQTYYQEIDYLAGHVQKTGRPPDVAFLPVSTSDGYQEDPILQGLKYAQMQLRPQRIIPMHAHGNERLYRRFAQYAQKGSWPLVLVPGKPGDSFQVESVGQAQGFTD